MNEIYGKYKGTIFVTLPTGIVKILGESEDRNLIVSAGKTLILGRLTAASVNSIGYMGVGKGTVEPALADTALGSAFGSRKAVSYSVTGSTSVTFTATWSASELNDTTEIGLFNSSSGTTMLCRSKHAAAISIPAGSSMTIDYTIGIVTSESITKTWTAYTGGGATHTWYIDRYVPVAAVYESVTGNGYSKQTSAANVEANANSYWADTSGNKLYVRTSTGLIPVVATHGVTVIDGV